MNRFRKYIPAVVRNLHELNMEQAECHCISCDWYGDNDEAIEIEGLIHDLECPICNEEVIPMYTTKRLLSDVETRYLIRTFCDNIILLSQCSDRYKPYYEISGVCQTVELRIFDENPCKDKQPVVGSYNYDARICFKTGRWDHLRFRDWIDGLAELIENEIGEEE